MAEPITPEEIDTIFKDKDNPPDAPLTPEQVGKAIDDLPAGSAIPLEHPEKADVKPASANVGVVNSGVIFHNLDEVYMFGQMVVQTGMFRNKLKTAQQVALAVLAGRELGIGAVTACNQVNVIKDAPSLSTKLMLSLVRRSGQMTNYKAEYSGTKDKDDWACTVSSCRKGEKLTQSHSFSVADAKRAGLWGKGAWSGYPEWMLFCRAASFHVSAIYPDITLGFVTTEEMDDFPQEARNVIPVPDAVTAEEDQLLDEVAT